MPARYDSGNAGDEGQAILVGLTQPSPKGEG
jgi:hypothetical protein